MIRWVVAIVLAVALLLGLSPWPSVAPAFTPGLVFPVAGELLQALLGLLGAAMGLTLACGVLLALFGGAFLLVLSLPVLLLLGVVALVFAPVLLPLLLLLLLVGAVRAGVGLAGSC